MFQHWIFWLVITLLVLAVLLVAQEHDFRDKVNGSINGKKPWVGFDVAWWDKNFYRVIGAVLIIGFGLMMFGCHAPSASGAPLPEWMMNILMAIFWVIEKLSGN